MRLQAAASLLASLALTGCALGPAAPSIANAGVTIQGMVHGGQQPISGAQVYLFAANTTGYGGKGIAATSSNASVSLLQSVAGSTALDTSGGATNGDYYVTTALDGSFTITGDYSCTPNTQVYLYALGGNPSGGVNPYAASLAILGSCPATGNFAASVPYISMNEVTTVAAANAFAGFATDATHVSSSGTPLALTGIAAAFANAANLARIDNGSAISVTPSGTGAPPASLINTLANILAACVNTAGAVTGPTNPTPCYTLLYSAQSLGSTGVLPTDIATAAINIVHNPATNVAALYNLQAAIGPFAGTYFAQPASFAVGISYTGGGLATPSRVAIDGAGNVWVVNSGSSHKIVELSSSGAFLSGTSGYTNAALTSPNAIAIDTSGTAWISNSSSPYSIARLSSALTLLSGTNGYTGGGLAQPTGIAFDGTGNAWVSNGTPASVSEFSSTGVPLSGANGYTGTGFNTSDNPASIAVDGAGSVWITDLDPVSTSSSIVKLSNTGAVLSGASAYAATTTSKPSVISLDSAGDAWVVGPLGSGVGQLSNTGALLSGSGYVTSFPGSALSFDGAGNLWSSNSSASKILELSNTGTALYYANVSDRGAVSSPQGLAVDGSGNVWIANSQYNSLVELVGAATPVITPIAAGLPSTLTTDGTSNLGTRP